MFNCLPKVTGIDYGGTSFLSPSLSSLGAKPSLTILLLGDVGTESGQGLEEEWLNLCKGRPLEQVPGTPSGGPLETQESYRVFWNEA